MKMKIKRMIAMKYNYRNKELAYVLEYAVRLGELFYL